jgi:hypothetical protein
VSYRSLLLVGSIAALAIFASRPTSTTCVPERERVAGDIAACQALAGDAATCITDRRIPGEACARDVHPFNLCLPVSSVLFAHLRGPLDDCDRLLVSCDDWDLDSADLAGCRHIHGD